MKHYINHWIYNGNIFNSSDIQDHYGFVYCITNKLNGKKYIGRKYFWQIRKKKGQKRRVKEESNWKSYYGSSKVLLMEISKFGSHNFKREILELYKTKAEVNYNEVKTQFKMDVLEATNENGERIFYNENIASRYFIPKNLHYKKTNEHKKKISETMKLRKICPKTRKDSPSEKTKSKISQTNKLNSTWVKNNPNSPDNILYTILTQDGIKEVYNLPQICNEKGFKFNNLRYWSKRNKKKDLHPKYNIRILSIKNTKTNKFWNYEFKP